MNQPHEKSWISEYHPTLTVITIQHANPDPGLLDKLDVALLQAIENPTCRHLIIDLGMVKNVPSRFLGTLAMLHEQMKKRGGSLRLCQLDKQLMELMKITRFDKLLTIYATREQALQNV